MASFEFERLEQAQGGRARLQERCLTVAGALCAGAVLGALLTAAVQGAGTPATAPAAANAAAAASSVASALWEAEFMAAPPDAASALEHLRQLTETPHLAGTAANRNTARHVRGVFEAAGLDTRVVQYDVMLSYPVSHAVDVSGGGEPPQRLQLHEPAVEGDPLSATPEGVGWDGTVAMPFNGYSPSGFADAEVVYANYGRTGDFVELEARGVDVAGKVVLVRYGRIFRGDKAANAADAGAVGCLIFSDPRDYANVTADGLIGPSYPDSKFLPKEGVQRGSILKGDGDPLTPGWASLPGDSTDRLSEDQADLPTVPTLPISRADASRILSRMGTVGALPDEIASEWTGGLPFAYAFGPGPAVVRMNITMNNTVVPIHNVVGRWTGTEEPDRMLLVGNHRDAWVAGAVDPSSGTAVMLETVQALGGLYRRGWRPRRTLVVCSWDAEEQGLIGSTEFAEEHDVQLRTQAVAYLNVDEGVAGHEKGFAIKATPQLDDVLLDVARKVQDPDTEMSLHDRLVLEMSKENRALVGRLGSGSDFTAYLQHLGIPSSDTRYRGTYPVYHSVYDDFTWMKRYGDPTGDRHAAVAAHLGLATLRLLDATILPLNYTRYAEELKRRADDVKSMVLGMAGVPTDVVRFAPLDAAVARFTVAAAATTELQRHAAARGAEFGALATRALNDRLIMAERAFCNQDGLSQRPWFKHMVWAPSRHDSYGSSAFPGISDTAQDAVEGSVEWLSVAHEIARAAHAVHSAAGVLAGELDVRHVDL